MSSLLLQQSQLLIMQQTSLSGVLRQLSGVQQALPVLCAQQQQQHAHGGWLPHAWGHGRYTSTQAAAAGSDDDTARSSSSSGRSHPDRRVSRQQRAYQARLRAYKARLPKARKYGPELRDWSPEAFEQMRLVVGYYDLPQNRDQARPALPTHVNINNLQTLLHTHAVDPYYKLALLSYRSKLQNMELIEGLHKTRAFLGQLSASPNFVPADLEGLVAPAAAAAAPAPAAAGQQQQTQTQEQAQQPPEDQDEEQKPAESSQQKE